MLVFFHRQHRATSQVFLAFACLRGMFDLFGFDVWCVCPAARAVPLNKENTQNPSISDLRCHALSSFAAAVFNVFNVEIRCTWTETRPVCRLSLARCRSCKR